MIGIAGLARSGKDTLCSCFQKILGEEGISVRRCAFADPIKEELDSFLLRTTNLDVYNEQDKEKLRPLIVEYAEIIKNEFGQDYWIKTIFEQHTDDFRIFTDVRFGFEIDFLKEKHDAFIFHISMGGNAPINKIEEENDPILKQKSDIQYLWPPYKIEGDDRWEEKVMDHARILWQMIPEEKRQKWKTLNLSKK